MAILPRVRSTILTRAIREESDALGIAADRGLDALVPRYSGWTVADLVCHTGDVHRWVASVIEERARERLPRKALGRQVDRAALTGWFRDGVDRLVYLLEMTDPAMPVWTLTDDGSVGFWERRMAHETAIHRWDAQSAHGITEPIRPRLAHSGLLESLVRHLPIGDREPTGGSGERLHIHCLDERGDWVMTLLPAGVRVEPGLPSADVDTTIVGSACDLWLLLTGRSFGAELTVDGDPVAFDALESALQVVAVPRLG